MRKNVAILFMVLGVGALAGEPRPLPPGVHYAEPRALGVVDQRFDAGHRVVGWRLGERWYFGRSAGGGKNLGFVWVRDSNRVSVGVNGLRWSRHF